MRKSIVLKVVGLAMVGVMVLAGPASARSWTAKTSVSLNANRHHHHAVFWGRLSSKRPACKNYKSIQLVRHGRVVEATHTTGAGGFFRLQHRARRNSKWRVRFLGTVKGVHPNIHVCLSSQSNGIEV